MDGLSPSLRQPGCRGLSATALKLIALVIMTIDHLGAYGASLPVIAEHVLTLRIIGRIAAPIFLFCAVESADKTRSRKRLFARLYVASLILALANIAVSRLLGGTVSFGNIFQTLAWTVAAIAALDAVRDALKEGRIPRSAGLLLAIGAVYGLTAVAAYFMRSGCWEELFGCRSGSTAAAAMARNLVEAFLPCPYYCEYSLGMIFLGCLWHITPKLQLRLTELLALSIVAAFRLLPSTRPFVMFGYLQWGMVGAIIPLSFYNGERGRGLKWLFYTYYPLHVYLIAIINYLYKTGIIA